MKYQRLKIFSFPFLTWRIQFCPVHFERLDWYIPRKRRDPLPKKKAKTHLVLSFLHVAVGVVALVKSKLFVHSHFERATLELLAIVLNKALRENALVLVIAGPQGRAANRDALGQNVSHLHLRRVGAGHEAKNNNGRVECHDLEVFGKVGGAAKPVKNRPSIKKEKKEKTMNPNALPNQVNNNIHTLPIALALDNALHVVFPMVDGHVSTNRFYVRALIRAARHGNHFGIAISIMTRKLHGCTSNSSRRAPNKNILLALLAATLELGQEKESLIGSQECFGHSAAFLK